VPGTETWLFETLEAVAGRPRELRVLVLDEEERRLGVVELVRKLVRGQARRGDWLVYFLAVLCVARFIYLD